jgi:Homeobox KN domain
VDLSNVTRSDWRPTLPSLPSLTLIHASAVPRGRNTFSEYALESSRSGAQSYQQLSASQLDPPTSYPPALSYGYQQPRGQSYSGPSTYSLTHDRSPFSSNHHNVYSASSFPYGLERDDGNDSKQRKRRGNLPKETTDKLRTWFVAHLQHPYPTEDEKQELMRQTGLQMSKFPSEYSSCLEIGIGKLLNAENRVYTDFRIYRG